MERLITCSLTQEPTYSPVICTKTGYIYDYQNIKKYLEKTDNKCPKTKMLLSFRKDFKKVQGLRGPTLNVRSDANRNSKSLKITENFYDLLKKAKEDKMIIGTLKAKLSASLKQQAASLRVIRKLQEQRDEVRNSLIQYKELEKLGNLGQPVAAESGAMEEENLPN